MQNTLLPRRGYKVILSSVGVIRILLYAAFREGEGGNKAPDLKVQPEYLLPI